MDVWNSNFESKLNNNNETTPWRISYIRQPRRYFTLHPFHAADYMSLGIMAKPQIVNTSRPRQNGRHFPDDIFKLIFFNENVWISINISPKFVPKAPINNIQALVQIMAWRRPGDKPLSEPMMVRLSTHICVTRPQWVNCYSVTRSFWLAKDPSARGKWPGHLFLVAVHASLLRWSNEQVRWCGWAHSTAL